MVALGYEIDRAVLLVFVVSLLALYCIQALSQFYPGWGNNKRFTVKWTSHRLGPLGGVCAVLRAIDSRQAFGIYTTASKLTSWWVMGQVSCIYIMAYSICFSVVLSNSNNMRVKVSPTFHYGLISLSILTPFVALAVLIAAYARDEPAREYYFYMWIGVSGMAVWLLFVWHGWGLRTILKNNLKNPALTKLAKKGFHKMTRSLLFASVLLGGANIYQIVTALQDWGKTWSKIANPEQFRLVYIATDVFLTAALMLLLWLSWIPVGFKIGAGPHGIPFAFYRVTGAVDSEGTGGSSDKKKSGGGKHPDSTVNSKAPKQLQIRTDRLKNGFADKQNTPSQSSVAGPESRGLLDAEESGMPPNLVRSSSGSVSTASPPNSGGSGGSGGASPPVMQVLAGSTPGSASIIPPDVRTILEDDESKLVTPTLPPKRLASQASSPAIIEGDAHFSLMMSPMADSTLPIELATMVGQPQRQQHQQQRIHSSTPAGASSSASADAYSTPDDSSTGSGQRSRSDSESSATVMFHTHSSGAFAVPPTVTEESQVYPDIIEIKDDLDDKGSTDNANAGVPITAEGGTALEISVDTPTALPASAQTATSSVSTSNTSGSPTCSGDPMTPTATLEVKVHVRGKSAVLSGDLLAQQQQDNISPSASSPQ